MMNDIFISLFIAGLYYIISSLPVFLIFKSLKVTSWYAFIPIYGIYRLLKEYKLRVYKKNWGVFYLLIYIFFLILSISFGFLLNISIENILIGIIGIIVGGISLFIVTFLIYFPIMYNNKLKIAYILFLILPILSQFFPLYSSNHLYYMFFPSILSLINFIFITLVSYNLYRKVVNNEVTIVDKISEKEDVLEIKRILYLRGRVLINKEEDLENYF